MYPPTVALAEHVDGDGLGACHCTAVPNFCLQIFKLCATVPASHGSRRWIDETMGIPSAKQLALGGLKAGTKHIQHIRHGTPPFWSDYLVVNLDTSIVSLGMAPIRTDKMGEQPLWQYQQYIHMCICIDVYKNYEHICKYVHICVYVYMYINVINICFCFFSFVLFFSCWPSETISVNDESRTVGTLLKRPTWVHRYLPLTSDGLSQPVPSNTWLVPGPENALKV